jgi:5,5'-dehydrodivanillate O-demethylase
MLSEDENRFLAQVGAGTPMGELMRRYWMPIAAVAELDDSATKPVRLMGEDLALYRDRSGTYGLVDRHCAHRRADLTYGYVEDCGLRCNYHGWLYDETGQCIEQPYEEIAHPEANFKDRIRMKAYPVQERAGLLWAYLGPLPAPELPDWDVYHDRGYKQIVFSHIPCNWFQCQENSIDPVHFEWLHSNWSLRMRGKDGPYSPTHLKIGFDEFEYGFVYRRVRADTKETDELWTVGRVCLWPNALYTGNHFEWRVPIDDENTLSVGWFLDDVPGDEPFEQERIPYWYSPIKDAQTGRWISSHVMNQDFIAWVGQGTNADRTGEHLGDSDRGVILMRRKMVEQAELVRDGGEPFALIRDATSNHKVRLPRFADGGVPAGSKDGPRPFAFQFGQPESITEEMRRVWALHGGSGEIAPPPEVVKFDGRA